MLGLLDLFMIYIGFVVGILSGFFGFGGGFIIAPFLISCGFPANISIGTSIMLVFMSSLVNSLRHRFLGNVEAKVGLAIASASILGAEFGARMIEHLKILGTQYMNFIINLIYILLLSLISAYTIHKNSSLKGENNQINMFSLWHKLLNLKIPPLIAILRSNKKKVSVWVVFLIGFISGLSAGFLGAGGGFILLPLLIYVIGYKPPIAAGTCALWVSLNSAYASLTHAFKGNINFILAIFIFSGSLIGLQIGITTNRYIKETNFKSLFGLCLCLISLSIFTKLLSEFLSFSFLSLLSPIIMFISASIIALFILFNLLREKTRKNKGGLLRA